MSVPSSYNAAELAAYMHGELGIVAQACAFTVGASYDQAIVKTLLAYGVTDIASATDVSRLLVLASVEAWRLAVTHTTPRTNISKEGRSVDRSQFYDHSRLNLEAAESLARAYPVNGSAMPTAGRVIVRYCDRY